MERKMVEQETIVDILAGIRTEADFVAVSERMAQNPGEFLEKVFPDFGFGPAVKRLSSRKARVFYSIVKFVGTSNAVKYTPDFIVERKLSEQKKSLFYLVRDTLERCPPLETPFDALMDRMLDEYMSCYDALEEDPEKGKDVVRKMFRELFVLYGVYKSLSYDKYIAVSVMQNLIQDLKEYRSQNFTNELEFIDGCLRQVQGVADEQWQQIVSGSLSNNFTELDQATLRQLQQLDEGILESDEEPFPAKRFKRKDFKLRSLGEQYFNRSPKQGRVDEQYLQISSEKNQIQEIENPHPPLRMDTDQFVPHSPKEGDSNMSPRRQQFHGFEKKFSGRGSSSKIVKNEDANVTNSEQEDSDGLYNLSGKKRHSSVPSLGSLRREISVNLSDIDNGSSIYELGDRRKSFSVAPLGESAEGKRQKWQKKLLQGEVAQEDSGESDETKESEGL